MNIYVGNLAADVDAEELRTLFEEFGKVDSCVIIKDRFTGESRGFGFVEMPTKDEAEQAISALNGKDLKGSSIKVNEARPRKNRWNNRRRRKGFYGR
ncbi:MAG: RNA-binding protein [Elusimicrobia bacterium]|nr:RNA-binding protein [Elusimicrobiota bacterium]